MVSHFFWVISVRARCENSLPVREQLFWVREWLSLLLCLHFESYGHFLGPAYRILISVRGCEKSYSRCGYSSTWCESGSLDLLII